MAHFKRFFYLIACISLNLCAVTFEELDDYIGKEIEIRGFLHQSDSGEWVLGSKPSLKCCCMGAKSKQVIVETGHAEASPYKVVTVRGKLKMEGGRYYIE